jgi:uncharacterized membrane protein
MSRILRVVFTLSLAFNLLVLGFAGALAWRLRQGPWVAIETTMTVGLDAPDAAILRQTLAADAPVYSAALDRAVVAHRVMDAALRQEPLDPQALRAGLDGWRLSMDGVLASFEPPLVTAAQAMSPAGRATLAALGDRQAARAASMAASLVK